MQHKTTRCNITKHPEAAHALHQIAYCHLVMLLRLCKKAVPTLLHLHIDFGDGGDSRAGGVWGKDSFVLWHKDGWPMPRCGSWGSDPHWQWYYDGIGADVEAGGNSSQLRLPKGPGPLFQSQHVMCYHLHQEVLQLKSREGEKIGRWWDLKHSSGHKCRWATNHLKFDHVTGGL